MNGVEVARFLSGGVFVLDPSREVAKVDSRQNLTEQVFQEEDGSFTLVQTRTELDGKLVPLDRDLFTTNPELYGGDPGAIRMRFRRLSYKRTAHRIMLPEVMKWAVRTHLPDCLVGAVLDCLNLPEAGEVHHE